MFSVKSYFDYQFIFDLMDFSHPTSGHLDNQRCTVLFKNLLPKENPFPAVASLYLTPFMRPI